jgi:hypothetical protein
MATKLAMPGPLAKSAILSGVDRPGLGECQLRADSPLPAQFIPFAMTFTNHRFRDFLGAL